ncbi:unnamed protein product [Allacma fusca]|uniref:Uncharacterized protein n=1 Tax=Allacma fusca TaxID=39272 RepID=A0A8J2KKY0_9HEXA|nr:unnamed protein product [Allacma fusca]
MYREFLRSRRHVWKCRRPLSGGCDVIAVLDHNLSLDTFAALAFHFFREGYLMMPLMYHLIWRCGGINVGDVDTFHF